MLHNLQSTLDGVSRTLAVCIILVLAFAVAAMLEAKAVAESVGRAVLTLAEQYRNLFTMLRAPHTLTPTCQCISFRQHDSCKKELGLFG